MPEIAFLLMMFTLTGLLMGLAIAVNKFSLHGMYRNRLIRAFLVPPVRRPPDARTVSRDSTRVTTYTCTSSPSPGGRCTSSTWP